MPQPEIIVIGSGMGGATIAAALAPTGRQILILERGEHLRDSPEARDATAIFARGHFRPKESWLDGQGRAFNPGNFYFVGGNTKMYGAVLFRFREADFSLNSHMGGTSAGWPVSYDDFAPYYDRAEALYQVRGALGADPSEPPHAGDYPHPPVPDEPVIADLAQRLRASGLHPSPLPLGVDLDRWLAGGKTPWDGHPDTCGGKMDAESCGLAEALKYPNVTLQTGTHVDRLLADENGRITGLEVTRDGLGETLSAPVVVLAAGAVNTAALLLRSADARHPAGLANSSDQVGRNFMNHNASAMLALHPLRRNPSVYQKTLTVNDFYLDGGPYGEPLGNVQLLGKISAPILSSQSGIPLRIAKWITDRSIDLYLMSEDLPDVDSRVTVKDGQIRLDWRRSNWEAHLALVAKMKQVMRRAGFPVVLSKAFDRRTPSHQCGTARMGWDSTRSVTDIWGRTHDHENLFIADASVLPTSGAVNPSLTVAAHALRCADAISEGWT
ncbi:GMC oxidoreductase [Puniceibacterium sediminis]|uniref:Choline dehydrogenase n=1 Tax=Puniceibacterium sediminis TaxID=1608407 RepID=A0A238XM91_9RHOB|nr:GMC family oxidoreductase [Puniceibacterium sediminis]SNR60126.1 Choline dehydrogenase [Puniceibacterium sediminis]